MTVDEIILNYLVFSFFIYLYVYKFIFVFFIEKHIYFLSVAYLANPYSVGEKKNDFFPTRQKLEFEKEHYMCPFVMYVNIESGGMSVICVPHIKHLCSYYLFAPSINLFHPVFSSFFVT